MSSLLRLRAALKEKGIDAIIVFDELNQHYLSGFAFTDGLLLITENHAELITDFRYIEMAQKEAFSEYNCVMPENRTDYIRKILSEDTVKTVGFEGDYLPYAVYKSYAERFSECEFINVGDMISVLREVKTPEEIKKMQAAQDITDSAFSHILKVITPEMTEIEVAAELEYYMRKSGASGLAFETIAVSGDASALPHGTPRAEKLHRGFLTMDFGAKFDGYCSDMTRTIVIGKADEEIKKLYNTVLKAQCSALDFLRAGVDAGEADKIARDIIDSCPEYKDCFGHSLGHSVGLFIHESPRLSKKSFGRALRVGEILTVEPGIYLFGKYGCRIEDMVEILENGVYNFTHSTKDLIEIY